MVRIPETGEMLLRQEPGASIKLVPGIETMRRSAALRRAVFYDHAAVRLQGAAGGDL